MISSVFDSASLAAITNVVLFLVTYIPYITVISTDAVMTLMQKLLIVGQNCNNTIIKIDEIEIFLVFQHVNGVLLRLFVRY